MDDEESILDVASQFFQRRGYQTFTACNGVEALKIIENESVDCCFTDIKMPEMNGLELAENIRMRDSTMPVIVMTGYPSLENTIQTLKNGVVDFLIKPVNLKQMEMCLLRVMQQHGLFVENVLLKEEVKKKERLEKLNRELLYKVDELNILNKIMGSFTTTNSTTDVFKRAVDMALEITHADHCMFYVINESVGRPFEVASAGTGGDKKEENEEEGDGSEDTHGGDDGAAAGGPALHSVADVAGQDREDAADLEHRGKDAADLGCRRRVIADRHHLLLIEQWDPHERPVRELGRQALKDQPAVGVDVPELGHLIGLDPVFVIAFERCIG